MSRSVGPRLLLVLGILAAFIPSHCKAATTGADTTRDYRAYSTVSDTTTTAADTTTTAAVTTTPAADTTTTAADTTTTAAVTTTTAADTATAAADTTTTAADTTTTAAQTTTTAAQTTTDGYADSTALATAGSTVKNPSRVQNEVSLTLKYVLVTVCTGATEKQVKTTVLFVIVKQNEAWPGLCTDSACTNADVTATCDGVNSQSITTVVIIEQLPDTLRSNGITNRTQISESPYDVLLAAAQGNAFNLTSIGAVLEKVLVALRRTCTPGYILTGTECVKQKESSIGTMIGGVIGSLGVVTFIALVVIVYRRLGRAGRRPSVGRGDEHDYSGLTPTGQSAGSGHSGRQAAIQLNHMGLDLNHPGHDGQIQRPVSDYDVIGEENPNIAKCLMERLPAREHRVDPAPCNPYDTIDTCHAPGLPDCTTLADEHADEVSHPDYLSPCSPRKENEEDSQPDYLTPCSSHEHFDKVIHSDYLTPSFGLNDSDKVNHSDYLTPCPKLDI